MRFVLRQVDGLGNQLFQYAAAQYFRRKYGAGLEILREPAHVARSIGHDRPFMLSHFRISCPVRERNRWDRLVSAEIGKKGTLGAAARGLSFAKLYRQPYEHAWRYESELPVGRFTQRFYLQGYFQAHQYAAAVEPQLRSDLQFAEEPSGQNGVLLRRIRQSATPVSLHVRRGDYTKLGGGSVALPMTYYPRAIAAARENFGNPTFFIFSDDIAFTREMFSNSNDMVFVDGNDEAHGYEDLRLMAACRHHIIANSTFSWWGAWLNPSPDKTVFAPDRWLQPGAPPPDLLPPEWLRIPTHSL